jgi:hypothetical protein
LLALSQAARLHTSTQLCGCWAWHASLSMPDSLSSVFSHGLCSIESKWWAPA